MSDVIYDVIPEGSVRVRSLGPVIVTYYAKQANGEDMQRVWEAYTSFFTEWPTDAAMMTIVGETAMNITPDTRKIATDMSRELANKAAVDAVVLMGRGIVGSLQRSLVTGFKMIANAKNPSRVFRDVDPAIEWLAHVAPMDVDKDRLKELCDGLLSRSADAAG